MSSIRGLDDTGSWRADPDVPDMLLRTLGNTDLQVSPLGLGMAALGRPWVDMVVSGAASIPQLESNLRAVDVVWDRQAAERTAPLAEAPAAYWQKRSMLAWN